MNDSAFIQCLKDRQAFLETIIAEKTHLLTHPRLESSA